ncbi:uncharacterized protein K460DRAFT_356009 [Cucurbitaria berberidis CBS 394.84]|uniref:Uncharacterized protein n=1 Tax=Cucurbitaria berberidis CBS 394.84 TaxID=1168544 RepID=A0A9P4GIY6_9PLEO|nr:uncharacterized protein K460DRAFT_356009 [Cucurbitaria berberidis CBS 394.84]KAF1846314.1 hypothetical protein K460DRAFT_356009 [Cucurbitaria berberidis CBS 394.84]
MLSNIVSHTLLRKRCHQDTPFPKMRSEGVEKAYKYNTHSRHSHEQASRFHLRVRVPEHLPAVDLQSCAKRGFARRVSDMWLTTLYSRFLSSSEVDSAPRRWRMKIFMRGGAQRPPGQRHDAGCDTVPSWRVDIGCGAPNLGKALPPCSIFNLQSSTASAMPTKTVQHRFCKNSLCVARCGEISDAKRQSRTAGGGPPALAATERTRTQSVKALVGG